MSSVIQSDLAKPRFIDSSIPQIDRSSNNPAYRFIQKHQSLLHLHLHLHLSLILILFMLNKNNFNNNP